MTEPERAAISLIWSLIQVTVFALLFFCCGIAGAYVSPNSAGVLTGLAVGAIAGIWFCHSARMWLLRLRLRRLRGEGVEARATVMVDRLYTPIGLGARYGDVRYPDARRSGYAQLRYTVCLRWVDPNDGTMRRGERRYRFLGPGSARFERIMDGMRVVVRYDEGHPERFVLDIPFAPTMADLVR